MTRQQIEVKHYMAFACIDCGAHVRTENAPDVKVRGNEVVWRAVPCPNCGTTYRCTVGR